MPDQRCRRSSMSSYLLRGQFVRMSESPLLLVQKSSPAAPGCRSPYAGLRLPGRETRHRHGVRHDQRRTGRRSRPRAGARRSSTATPAAAEQRRAAAISDHRDRLPREGSAERHRQVARLPRHEFLRQRTLRGAVVEADVAGKGTDPSHRRYDQEIDDATPSTEVIIVKTEERLMVSSRSTVAPSPSIAKAKSSDGSAAQGGDLGWFGPGQMVPGIREGRLHAGSRRLRRAGFNAVSLAHHQGQERRAAAPAFDQVKDPSARRCCARSISRWWIATGQGRIPDPELKGVEQVEKSQSESPSPFGERNFLAVSLARCGRCRRIRGRAHCDCRSGHQVQDRDLLVMAFDQGAEVAALEMPSSTSRSSSRSRPSKAQGAGGQFR